MSDLASAIDELTSHDVAATATSDLADELIALHRLRDRLDAQILRRARELDARGAREELGAFTSAAWLRRECGLSHTKARDAVRVANRLLDLPGFTPALADGTITLEHATRIANAMNKPHKRERASADEPVLLEAAHRLDVGQFARVVAHWERLADPDGNDPGGDDKVRVTLGDAWNGIAPLGGQLDVEGAAIMRAAAEAMMDATKDAHAGRTYSERFGHALIDICRFALEHMDTPTDVGDRPHITVVVERTPSSHRRFHEGGWALRTHPDGWTADVSHGMTVRPSRTFAGHAQTARLRHDLHDRRP